jgi:hypothetical protein
MPRDYLNEAFGVDVVYGNSKEIAPKGRSIIIREDSFKRNAKYLSIWSSTQEIIDFATINTELKKNQVFMSNNVSKDSVLDELILSRRDGGVIPTTKAVVVETDIQKQRKLTGASVKCSHCMDEKEVIFEINTRRYCVPCRFCGDPKNQSGIWFEEFEKKNEAEKQIRTEPPTEGKGFWWHFIRGLRGYR